MEYLGLAGSAWFAGFFPLAEIYVAIPLAMAMGLDDASVFFWTVFGNITPILLISFLYDYLVRVPRIRQWLERLVSERFANTVNRYGIGVVLLITPWVGVWVVSVTARVLGMSQTRLIATASTSVVIYAIALTFLLRTGASFVG